MRYLLFSRNFGWDQTWRIKDPHTALHPSLQWPSSLATLESPGALSKPPRPEARTEMWSNWFRVQPGRAPWIISMCRQGWQTTTYRARSAASVVPSFSGHYGPQPARLPCPRGSSGKHSAEGCPSSSRGSSRPRDRTRVPSVSFMTVCVRRSVVCLTLCDPWTAARQASLPVGLSGQGY